MATSSARENFAARFRRFVASATFPCVGAKSAMNRDRISFGLYDQLGGADDTVPLCEALADFSDRHPTPGSDPVSFVAMFQTPVANEDEFHQRLWHQLQAMHDHDMRRHDWDESVSADVDDPAFSFSIAGRAFFVVGLHPQSSRLARRAPFPCLVFNFHNQFEAMREDGRYAKLQAAIRARDIALQGDINPVLANFGESSEALQYSGRPSTGCGDAAFHARCA